ALPPNPSLLAILLVIRTRAGQPRLVFHYPPTPSVSSTTQTAPPAHASWYGGASTGAEGDESSTEDSTDSDDDAQSTVASQVGSEVDREEEKRSKSGSLSKRDGSKGRTVGSVKSGRVTGARRDIDDELEGGSGDDEDESGLPSDQQANNADGHESGSHRPLPWDQILGFEADTLSKLLTPGRAFNKRTFETGIDNLVFLSAPMFAREDGAWRKHKKRKIKRRNRPKPDHREEHESSHDDAHPAPVDSDSGIDVRNGRTDPDVDFVSGFESAYGHGLISGAASALPSGAASEVASLSDNENQMTMFNVIFVMNPPALEYHLRVDDIYDHAAKKLAKYLKHEQGRRDYVWDQAMRILAIKEKARESRAPVYMLWPNIMNSSSLAKAMAHIFDALSVSKIAHVNLDNEFDIAFQIPQPESTPFLSTATEPQVPGLWLTTGSFTGDDDADSILNPHSALLLLEDEDTLIKEIETDDKELSGPLVWFIRNLTPTKSLQKLFSNSTMAFNDSLFLARHLIYWRRARAIPPLHHRDTYVVSPNADVRALPAAIVSFANRFPTLPPLPKILHLLSGVPRPYYMLMPTKDHRFAYMEILAWLMRGGWITQVKSFGWVSVPTKVKSAVAMKLAEELRAKKRLQSGLDPHPEEIANGISTAASIGHRSTESGSTASLTNSPSGSAAHSPHLSAYRVVSSQSDAIKDIITLDTTSLTPTIIHSPQKANANESRWIEHIGSSFTDPELTELWPIMLKYFDGKHALDEIALREGLKRKKVASVIARL
ncbi:hypothetical protein NA57DRAFT_8741, partial [Rhizodiscina lignyota]